MLHGKFASTNQKHYTDLGSDTSSVWNFCIRGETSCGATKFQLFLQASGLKVSGLLVQAKLVRSATPIKPKKLIIVREKERITELPDPRLSQKLTEMVNSSAKINIIQLRFEFSWLYTFLCVCVTRKASIALWCTPISLQYNLTYQTPHTVG